MRSSKFPITFTPFRIPAFHGISSYVRTFFALCAELTTDYIQNRLGIANAQTVNPADHNGVQEIWFKRVGWQRDLFHTRFQPATASFSTSSDPHYPGILQEVHSLVKENQTGQVEMVDKIKDLIIENQQAQKEALDYLKSMEELSEANTANMAEELSNLKV